MIRIRFFESLPVLLFPSLTRLSFPGDLSRPFLPVQALVSGSHHESETWRGRSTCPPMVRGQFHKTLSLADDFPNLSPEKDFRMDAMILALISLVCEFSWVLSPSFPPGPGPVSGSHHEPDPHVPTCPQETCRVPVRTWPGECFTKTRSVVELQNIFKPSPARTLCCMFP